MSKTRHTDQLRLVQRLSDAELEALAEGTALRDAVRELKQRGEL